VCEGNAAHSRMTVLKQHLCMLRIILFLRYSDCWK